MALRGLLDFCEVISIEQWQGKQKILFAKPQLVKYLKGAIGMLNANMQDDKL